MSLDTVPKTNWTAKDGVQLTDMNEIGSNIQALEDSKYESGDDITVGTITSGDITAENTTVEDLTISGVILPTTSPTEGSEVIASGSTWTPDRGYYVLGGGVSGDFGLEVQVSSTWRALSGSSFFSDGTNVRVKNLSVGTLTAYYLKF